MNKSELINAVAERAELTKVKAEHVVDAFISSITGALKVGESVMLVGFGTFTVVNRPARVGRNPQTGKTLAIPANKSPRFKAGKTLKEAVGLSGK